MRAAAQYIAAAQLIAVQNVIEALHSMDCVQLAAAIIPRGARLSDLDW